MISNGGNFQVAARLAYITGNDTYLDWAEMVWDWMADTAMFDRTDDGLLYIWDNVNADKDCGEPVKFIWSYNYGVLLGGLAYMYNTTDGDPKWRAALDEMLDSAIRLYFPEERAGIMEEYLCEENGYCNQDQKSFKAYLSRWLATTAMLVPDTWDTIIPLLTITAEAAAGQCTGGSSGTMCSQKWWEETHTGETGVGEQVSHHLHIHIPILSLTSRRCLPSLSSDLLS
jgi:mannan endo-1,6-alpha-mannosidase